MAHSRSSSARWDLMPVMAWKKLNIRSACSNYLLTMRQETFYISRLHRLQQSRRFIPQIPHRADRRQTLRRAHGESRPLDDPLCERRHGRQRRQACGGSALHGRVRQHIRTSPRDGAAGHSSTYATSTWLSIAPKHKTGSCCSSKWTTAQWFTRWTQLTSFHTSNPKCAKYSMPFVPCWFMPSDRTRPD